MSSEMRNEISASGGTAPSGLDATPLRGDATPLRGGDTPLRGGARESASEETPEADDGSVNYEESPLIELQIDGIDYRLDAGRAGTALCISTRPSGTWSWVFRGEARWQAKVLRCKAFDRTVLSELSKALDEAATDSE